ncbi:MAG: CheY-like chemotaxis protein [Pseudoalteromonas distincta]|jgi:CheY-like chemotaxis protein
MRALYIDDDRILLELVSMSFGTDLESVVRVTSDTNEAVDLIRDEKYDVILLDAVMPGICAADLIDQINATSNSPPPIIYITGLALEHQQVSLMQNGAVGVITKPFDPFDLLRHVRQLIDAPVASDHASDAGQAA